MKRIIILARNVPGELAGITEILAAHGINIEDIDADGSGDAGLIHVVVDRYDEALHVLQSAGHRAMSEEPLLLWLEDKPGALARVAVKFRDAGLDVRSLHILRRRAGQAVVTVVTSDNARAADVVPEWLSPNTH